jgi:hypothetical protein
MLTSYLTSTRRLLQFPSSATSLYTDSDLKDYINTARGQLAGESESIRFAGILPLTSGNRAHTFSAISFAGSSGIAGAINVRQMLRGIGTGYSWMRPRPFEWFTLYNLNNPNPVPGPPVRWAQFGQGTNGTIYVDPVPDANYTTLLDVVCYPIPLVDDNTTEAIPYLWTDAVPYFAAYLALLTAQAAARQADANRMMQRYEEFVSRARQFATPSVLPGIYPQSGNPVRANQLGTSPPAKAAQ